MIIDAEDWEAMRCELGSDLIGKVEMPFAASDKKNRSFFSWGCLAQASKAAP